jgi:predicted glycoside hydrolase/deacetylase ChbG (UPF0249 family)
VSQAAPGVEVVIIGAIGPWSRNLTLIVNADDLGLSEGVNAGIIESHTRGVVTSASLMVLRPAAAAAAAEVRGHPDLAIGLHLELDRTGMSMDSVAQACRDQVETFGELIGREPTHVDSHHHAHMRQPVKAVAGELADDLGGPLRGREIRYEGGFFARSGGRPALELVSAESLVSLIESLPSGWTEIGCHPGRGVGEESSYASAREVELQSLCDPRVVEAIARGRVELRSFADLPRPSALPPHRSLDSGVDGGR